MSEEIKETYLKLPNVTVGELQDVVDFMEDEDIEYIEFYEKDLKQQIEDLQQKVEQLEKELKETNNLLHKANDEVVSYCNRCIELENIRKEAIEIINQYMPNYASCVKALDELENILNKGSEE